MPGYPLSKTVCSLKTLTECKNQTQNINKNGRYHQAKNIIPKSLTKPQPLKV